MLIKESLRHLAQVYQRLGIKLTNADVRAESFYNPMLPEVVAELEAKGLAKETQGALGVFLPGYKNKEGEPVPLLIRKSDGGYLYATTDFTAMAFATGPKEPGSAADYLCDGFAAGGSLRPDFQSRGVGRLDGRASGPRPNRACSLWHSSG